MVATAEGCCHKFKANALTLNISLSKIWGKKKERLQGDALFNYTRELLFLNNKSLSLRSVVHCESHIVNT